MTLTLQMLTGLENYTFSHNIFTSTQYCAKSGLLLL